MRIKDALWIIIFVLAICLFPTGGVRGAESNPLKSYSGTITAINSTEKSFVLTAITSVRLGLTSQLFALIWPWSKPEVQAIKVLVTDDTKIQIKSGQRYLNSNFSNLRNNDKATVKGRVTDLSLSSSPSTIVTASEIRVTSRTSLAQRTSPQSTTSKPSSTIQKPSSTSPPIPQPPLPSASQPQISVPSTPSVSPTSSAPPPSTPLKTYHNVCKRVSTIDSTTNNYPLFKCFKVEGSGSDECQIDADCNPQIPVAATHNECQKGRCVKVLGAGNNQCTVDSDCEERSLPPTPPPESSRELPVTPDLPPQNQSQEPPLDTPPPLGF